LLLRSAFGGWDSKRQAAPPLRFGRTDAVAFFDAFPPRKAAMGG